MRSKKRAAMALAPFVIFAGVSAAQEPFPSPQGMVNDFANEMSPTTKRSLESRLARFRLQSIDVRHGNVDLRVVTLRPDHLRGRSIEEYSLGLGRQWQVGSENQNRGVILLVVIEPRDRSGVYPGQTRLEVSRELEGRLPNQLAGQIARNMRNDLMAGRVDEAITQGVNEVIASLIGLQPSIDWSKARTFSSPGSGFDGIWSAFVFLWIVLFIAGIIGAIIHRGRSSDSSSRPVDDHHSQSITDTFSQCDNNLPFAVDSGQQGHPHSDPGLTSWNDPSLTSTHFDPASTTAGHDASPATYSDPNPPGTWTDSTGTTFDSGSATDSGGGGFHGGGSTDSW